MTPTDYASVELDLWEEALRDQCAAEAQLNEARRRRRPKLVIELMPVIQALRTRADLLLAEAVKVKCSFTAAQELISDWGSTTCPGPLQDGASA